MNPIHFISLSSWICKKRLQSFLLAIFIGGVLEWGFAQSIPTNGLVAYYPLHGNANDASGNGNNGHIQGLDWQYGLDQIGNANALYLNLTDPTNFSVGTYVAAPRSASLDFNQNFTLSVWVNIPNGLPASHVHNLIGNGPDSTSANFRIISAVDGTNDYLQFVGNSYPPGPELLDIHAFIPPVRNTWWQAVVVRSGTNVSLFRNGGLVTNSAILAPLVNGPAIWIGSMPLSVDTTPNSGEYPLDGGIADIRIYNRVLSSNDVAALYALESTPPIPAITTDVSNTSAVIGSNVTFQVTTAGSAPFTYQWYWTNNNASQFAQAYAETIFGFLYGVVVTNGGFGYGNIPNVSFAGGGGTAQAYATVSNGVVTGVSVTNSSSGFTSIPSVVIDPPNGAMFGQTNITLTISNVNSGNLGGYYVIASNAYGSVTSSIGDLTVLYPPSIVSNPNSVDLSLHGSNTLTVSATGTSPLSFQWSFNSTNIAGATGTNYSITNFALTNIGNYAAIVSNPYGTVTSTAASVQMIPSLTIPFSGSVGLWGQTTTLSVGAVGSGLLNYQWYFNGVPIGEATSNTYTLPGVQFTNAGLYSVVASNAYGSVSNTAYQLVVNPANVDLNMYPGVGVTGTVGYAYTIQSTMDLSNTNLWMTETNIALSAPYQIWHDDSQPNNRTHKFYRVVAGTVSAPRMSLIPAGVFTMGDTLDGLPDAVPISVNVSGFYMDTNLVSLAQWQEVYNWAITNGYSFDNAGSGKAPNHPVQTLSWFDIVKWCNARSEQERRVPAYYNDAGLTTIYRTGQLSPGVNWNTGYRLPTEAEWEKAARGGLRGQRFPWGNLIGQSQANYYRPTAAYAYDLGPDGANPIGAIGGSPYTTPVGSFAPNGYGLFDMAGNLYEWCWDWYGTPYAGGTDPRGPNSGDSRVLRGGAWYTPAYVCRLTYRSLSGQNNVINVFGFRCVLPLGQ